MATSTQDQGTTSQAADAAKQHAREVAGSARDERDKLVGKVDTHVRRLAEEGRSTATQRADSQLANVAASLRSASEEMRSMADGSDVPDGTVTQLTSSSADSLSSLADRLDEGGARGALQDLRRFGRERPGVFVGLCFAAGLAAGRVFRNADNEALKDAVTPEEGEDPIPDPRGSTATGAAPRSGGADVGATS